MQHGEAVPEDENPDRPLTEKGVRDVQRLAAFLARGRTRVGRVIHSGRRRALETALLMAEVIGPGREVDEAESGLAPGDSTGLLAELAARMDEDFMVVGHMPFLGRMVSRLVAGNEDAGIAAFVPGTVACLERSESGDSWTILWLMGPAQLGL